MNDFEFRTMGGYIVLFIYMLIFLASEKKELLFYGFACLIVLFCVYFIFTIDSVHAHYHFYLYNN